MAEIIIESGMNFIADNTFHIEKSPQYTRLKGSVRSVEFVRAKDDKLIFVEAKLSFPNPGKADEDRPARFHEEVGVICEKFIHSLNLYSSIYVGITEEDFPADFKPADKTSLVFVLVIKSFERGWCIPVEKALTNKLRQSRCIANIWKPEVFVMNEESAEGLLVEGKR